MKINSEVYPRQGDLETLKQYILLLQSETSAFSWIKIERFTLAMNLREDVIKLKRSLEEK